MAALTNKTNTGLVDYVKSKIGIPYVYGAKMEILTKARFDELKKLYGSMVWDSDINKVGRTCCDCSGLISAYTGVTRGSSNYHDIAKGVFPISTVSTAPVGALVWKQGHIGVYVGMENGVPMYIAEDGSAYGCRKAKLPGVFTHWFLCTDIQYLVAGSSGSPSNSPAKQEDDNDMITLEHFTTLMAEYQKKQGEKPATLAEFAEAKDAGITDGTRPLAFVTRQEAAVMALRTAKNVNSRSK